MRKIIKMQDRYIVVDKITDFGVDKVKKGDEYKLNIYLLANGTYSNCYTFTYKTQEEAEADLNRLIEAIEGE